MYRRAHSETDPARTALAHGSQLEEDELTLTAERVVAPDQSDATDIPTITIRAYLYPKDGRWYAAATEMVLLAEGETEEEAIKSFLESSYAYIATALEHGWLDALTRRPRLARRVEIRARARVGSWLHRHTHFFQKRLEFAA